MTSTGLSVNITPSATSSKIFIISNVLLYNSGGSAEMTILKGATNLAPIGKFVRINPNAAYMPPSTMTWLDSPSSTFHNAKN